MPQLRIDLRFRSPVVLRVVMRVNRPVLRLNQVVRFENCLVILALPLVQMKLPLRLTVFPSALPVQHPARRMTQNPYPLPAIFLDHLLTWA